MRARSVLFSAALGSSACLLAAACAQGSGPLLDVDGGPGGSAQGGSSTTGTQSGTSSSGTSSSSGKTTSSGASGSSSSTSSSSGVACSFYCGGCACPSPECTMCCVAKGMNDVCTNKLCGCF